MELVGGDGLDPVAHDMVWPQRQLDESGNPTECRQPVDLLHEVGIRRVTQGHQHDQLPGENQVGIGLGERPGRLVDPFLHTLPDPRILQFFQPGAQLLIGPFDRKAEGSFVHGELVRASGNERVHAVHGGSHATDEVRAIGDRRIQDLPGRRQRFEHGDLHAPETCR